LYSKAEQQQYIYIYLIYDAACISEYKTQTFDGNDHSLIEALSQNLAGVSEENREKPESG
jgi:hypothetical protein